MCLLAVINSRRTLQGEHASTQVYAMSSVEGATRSRQIKDGLPSFLKSNVSEPLQMLLFSFISPHRSQDAKAGASMEALSPSGIMVTTEVYKHEVRVS